MDKSVSQDLDLQDEKQRTFCNRYRRT